jgi:peptide/nickel transport system permease protein
MRLRYYIIRRLVLLIPVILGVALITFGISHVIPADPARAWAGEKATDEYVEQLREAYHLNEPLYIQFFYYVDSLSHGDLGTSPTTGRPVIDDLKDYFPATLELTLVSMVIAIVVGIPLGVLSATKKDRPVDHITRIFSLSGVSMPIFWLGLLMILAFSFHIDLLPSGGRIDEWLGPPTRITNLYILDSLLTLDGTRLMSSIEHIIMPAICLAYATLALITRMTRSSMLEVLNQDYIKSAKAKGLPERTVIYKHALRNALIPTTTVMGLAFGSLLGGAVLTETIFSWPGIGRYAVDAIVGLDFSAIMGFTLLVALVYVLANLIVDILYAVLDPRIRYE